MGIRVFGAPREEIEFLKQQHSPRFFVETGTFQGNTSEWAASRFERVITIEGSPSHHQSASQRLSHLPNIDWLCGDSRTILPQVLDRIGEERSLFWLDAHWMPGCFGQAAECPIIEELNLINQSRGEHVILVDDARLFLAPPPFPHKAKDWPAIGAVLDCLNSSPAGPRYTVIHGDVIYSVPANIAEAAMEFFQQKVTTEANEQYARPNILQRVFRRLGGA